MAQWPGPWGPAWATDVFPACMQEVSSILPRPHNWFVYWSFVEVFIKKDAFIVRIDSFEQISSCQIWNLWQQFQLACFQKLAKVETFIYQRIAKTCSSAVVLQLLACFQKWELLFARNCWNWSTSAPTINTLWVRIQYLPDLEHHLFW